MIKIAVDGLKHLVDKVVFTGGATVPLYLDDKAATEPRPTKDVDCIIKAGLSEFYKIEKELNKLGFQSPDEKGEPICRKVFNKLKIDFIPTDTRISGFLNKWHKIGAENYVFFKINKKQKIKILSTPLFIASKLEAFENRGNGDYRTSHDIEDIVTILNGNSKVLKTILEGREDVKKYLKEKFSKIAKHRSFSEIIYAHLSQFEKNRLEYIQNIIQKIAQMWKF